MLILNRLANTNKRLGRHHRGITFLELMIAVAIFTTVMTMMIDLLVEVMKRQKSTNTQLTLLYNSANLHRRLRTIAAVGAQIELGEDQADSDNDGIRGFVRFVNTDLNETSELRFVDIDRDITTIDDNFIEFIEDITAVDSSGNPLNRVEVRYVTPLTLNGVEQPVFTRENGTPDPLVVRFRAGDRAGPGDPIERAGRSRTDKNQDLDTIWEKDDAVTGPGLQSIIFRGAYAPRNS